MIIEPGSYNARFYLRGRVLSGIVDLEARKPVGLEIYDPDGISRSGDFPQERQVDRLVGQLWGNEDIVLHHVQLSENFPGRYTGVASYALVGLGIQGVESRLCCVDFQVEGLDEFLWTRPSKRVSMATQSQIKRLFGGDGEGRHHMVECRSHNFSGLSLEDRALGWLWPLCIIHSRNDIRECERIVARRLARPVAEAFPDARGCQD
jgi:hypothetical protein